MKIDIITLFPDMFAGPFAMSMLWKAQDRGLATISLHDLRQYGLGERKTVDDTPYGGGDGMLLRCEPVAAAIDAAKESNPDAQVIFLTAAGQKFDQARATELSKTTGLILVCGHYEGFDQRVIDAYGGHELSIGDFVLTGGELASMVVVDAVVRLLPGVLGGEASAHEESFSGDFAGLVEYPHYTRPEEWRGEKVPDVLQSGHHAEIAKWRRAQAEDRTRTNRPDLLAG
jgi:tRNA (guanine37-N1)-methyltransferase